MRDGKRVVITYGTYDLLHYGHIRLMERAKELGDYLIVGVTSDAFDRDRGKLNVYQSLSERMNAVLATGIPDKVIVEEFQGQKIADIIKYGVDVFAIGSDWEGKFDFLKKYCEVMYLERTKGVSSTELRADKNRSVAVGCIGADYLTGRFISESAHVPGADVFGAYQLDTPVHESVRAAGVSLYDSLDDMLEHAEAVYFSATIDRHADLIDRALDAGCHVLCESPLFLSRADGERLFAKARERGLVLMEALKTVYFPAFEHLRLLLASGVIGEVKDIAASFSQIPDFPYRETRYQGAFYDMGAYGVLPAIAFLGSDYQDARLICVDDDGYNVWTKAELVYGTATATLSVGRGLKTEGDMVITGESGYVYVPAPWWKPDYFEIRHEDLRDTRKFFYGYQGGGQRYETFEFMRRVRDGADAYPARFSEDEVLATTDLVERFDAGDVVRLGHGKYAFGGGERVTDR